MDEAFKDLTVLAAVGVAVTTLLAFLRGAHHEHVRITDAEAERREKAKAAGANVKSGTPAPPPRKDVWQQLHRTGRIPMVGEVMTDGSRMAVVATSATMRQDGKADVVVTYKPTSEPWDDSRKVIPIGDGSFRRNTVVAPCRHSDNPRHAVFCRHCGDRL